MTTRKPPAPPLPPAPPAPRPDTLRRDLSFAVGVVQVIPIEPAPLPGPAVPQKLYASAAAEMKADERHAEQARARWHYLADEIAAGRGIEFIPDRMAVEQLIRDRAARVQVGKVGKRRGRGNPNFSGGAIYDRANVAFQVAFAMRRYGDTLESAAGKVAQSLGRDDETAVRKCYTELRAQAEAQVELVLDMERRQLIRLVERKG